MRLKLSYKGQMNLNDKLVGIFDQSQLRIGIDSEKLPNFEYNDSSNGNPIKLNLWIPSFGDRQCQFTERYKNIENISHSNSISTNLAL